MSFESRSIPGFRLSGIVKTPNPDGIALVNGATVVQFLSYEGVFVAANGPAAGMTSTDIGVAPDGNGRIDFAVSKP